MILAILRDEERDRHGDRPGDHERDERGLQGAEREGRDAELLAVVRVPEFAAPEIGLVVLERGDGLGDEEDRDGGEQNEDEHTGG
jgi:hypothetical protein